MALSYTHAAGYVPLYQRIAQQEASMYYIAGLNEPQLRALQMAEEHGCTSRPYFDSQFLLIIPSGVDLGSSHIVHDRFVHLFPAVELHTVNMERVVYRVRL